MKIKSAIISILAISLSLNSATWARREKTHVLQQTYSIVGPQDRLIPWPFIPADSILLIDSEGKMFIVLDKESSRYEYLAYLLGRDRFNIPEIRTVSIKEVRNEQLSAWMEQNGLSEITVSRLLQSYDCSELPIQKDSLAGLIVFWAFLRDGDHHFYNNLYDLEPDTGQKVYMSYDHSDMNTDPISVSSWIENDLQISFKRLFNVANIPPAAVINMSYQARQYYTDELLANIVLDAGFSDDLLQLFKTRRDSLVSDIETLLVELGVLSKNDVIISSGEQGAVIIGADTVQNTINKYSPEITVAQIKAAIENPDHPVEIVNYPFQYIYIKHIGDKRIRVKVNNRGEVFWADSQQLVIY